MKHLSRYVPNDVIWLVIAVSIYVVLFPLAVSLVGGGAATLYIFVQVTGSWRGGIKGGIAAWLLMFPLFTLLFQWVGVPREDLWVGVDWIPGTVAALVVGIIIGYIRNLSHSLKQELIERQKTEAALRHSEAFNRRITEASSDIVYVFDLAEQRFVYTSRSLSQVLGYEDNITSREDEQRFLKRTMHPDDWPLLLKKLQQYQTVQDGELIEEEYRLQHKNGGWHWFYNRETVFTRNADGSPAQIVGASQDITERKRAAVILNEKEKLEAALEKEKELAQLKNRFMSVISHEFRTPLAIVQSSSELLDRYYLKMSEARREEALSTIREQIGLFKSMLDDISLVVAGENHLDFKPVITDVRAFCSRLVEELRTARSHPLDFTGHGDLSQIPVDTRLLHHILTNLISNAIKYSPDGEPVHLIVHREDDAVNFAVHDHGIGIPLDDQRHIFETFFRAHNVGEIGGTGLGLRIVRDYVTLHGGTITMESSPGVGSIFSVRLPVVDAAALTDVQPALVQAQAASERPA